MLQEGCSLAEMFASGFSIVVAGNKQLFPKTFWAVDLTWSKQSHRYPSAKPCETFITSALSCA